MIKLGKESVGKDSGRPTSSTNIYAKSRIFVFMQKFLSTRPDPSTTRRSKSPWWSEATCPSLYSLALPKPSGTAVGSAERWTPPRPWRSCSPQPRGGRGLETQSRRVIENKVTVLAEEPVGWFTRSSHTTRHVTIMCPGSVQVTAAPVGSCSVCSDPLGSQMMQGGRDIHLSSTEECQTFRGTQNHISPFPHARDS